MADGEASPKPHCYGFSVQPQAPSYRLLGQSHAQFSYLHDFPHFRQACSPIELVHWLESPIQFEWVSFSLSSFCTSSVVKSRKTSKPPGNQSCVDERTNHRFWFLDPGFAGSHRGIDFRMKECAHERTCIGGRVQSDKEGFPDEGRIPT